MRLIRAYYLFIRGTTMQAVIVKFKRAGKSTARLIISFFYSLYYHLPYNSQELLRKKYRKIVVKRADENVSGWRWIKKEIGKKLKTKPVLRRMPVGEKDCVVHEFSKTPQLRKIPGSIAIHLHLYYIELANEFFHKLANVPFPFDLYITVRNEADKKSCELIYNKLPNMSQLKVIIVENRGRDIAPMVCNLNKELLKYDYFAHLHSKKSVVKRGGAAWRRYMMNGMLKSAAHVRKIFMLFSEDNKVGIIYPQMYFPAIPWQNWVGNKEIGTMLCKRMGIVNIPQDKFDFPAGSMFWARSKAMEPLLGLNLGLEEFPIESGQVDGTIAHAIERIFVLVARKAGFEAAILPDIKHRSQPY